MTSPYEVLGVSSGASDEAIRAAFRKAAKACHPDLNDGDEVAARQFREIAAARDTILKNRKLHSGKGYLLVGRTFDLREFDDASFKYPQVYLRPKVTARGVIFVLLCAWLISSAIVLVLQWSAVTPLEAHSGQIITGQVIAGQVIAGQNRSSGPNDAALDPGRATAEATETKDSNTKDSPPDRSEHVTMTDRVVDTNMAPAIPPAGDRRQWRPQPVVNAAPKSSSTPDSRHAPTPVDAKRSTTKPKGAPADGRAHAGVRPDAGPDEPRMAERTPPLAATAMASAKTDGRMPAGAPPAGRAAPLPLRPNAASAPLPEPRRMARPAYTLNGCWTDEGNGRWSPCTGGGD
jgi:hypothetical protein